MHLYFSGIGGAGVGPLALIAHQLGYQVSGSDMQNSAYIEYLKKHGITDINIGQSREDIAKVHEQSPIDWLVYSSSLIIGNPNAPEIVYAKEQGIRSSKRDELLNAILKEKNLKLIAIAGTHGKTTTTAMATWLFKDLDIPISYLLPAKTSFAQMGKYTEQSEYFVYEADEFDRNFLSFEPYISLITGVSWDHHEIYPTREDYQEAFREFISQSGTTYIWREDADYLNVNQDNSSNVNLLDSSEPEINDIKLVGKYNRLDARLTIQALEPILNVPRIKLIESINRFPGLSRRMEMLAPGLYTDYAHTPEKIKAAINAALEIAASKGQALVVVYEPLTDRRQHYIKELYKDVFDGVERLYWVPSYLAREDKNTPVLTPIELITYLSNSSMATPAEKNDRLKKLIQDHLSQGDMVVGIAGGGGGSLDDWLRKEFT